LDAYRLAARAEAASGVPRPARATTMPPSPSASLPPVDGLAADLARSAARTAAGSRSS
jgi:hypothetical protein